MEQDAKLKKYSLYLGESFFVSAALIIQLEIKESIWQILLFILAFAFIQYTKGFPDSKKAGMLLSIFLSFTLILGKCYYINESILSFWKEPVKLGIILLGNALLIMRSLNWGIGRWRNITEKEWTCGFSKWIFGKKCFYKIGMILLVLWSPVIVLSFPGNISADAVRQIEQVLGIVSYSGHHPLFSTLLIGGSIKAGHMLFGSYDIALFVYIWLQSTALAFTLAATVCTLKERRSSHLVLLCLLSVYVFAPVYSNITSTVIKDVPFMIAVIWYIMLWAELCTDFKILKNTRFLLMFFVTQILVVLLRNNGIYMLLISHILFFFIRYRDMITQKIMKKSLFMLFLPIIMGVCVNSFLFNTLNAHSGSRREMLSLPFQQTARYVLQYEDEITAEEKEIIDAILTDTISIARNYDPNIADPVKVLYRDQASIGEHIQYFKIWVKWFFRHPQVYFDAFFAHVYGWFCPLIPNEIRYEAESDIFAIKELFPGSDKMLVDFYRRLDGIAPLGLLENVGIYTWMLFILSSLIWKKDRRRITIFIPLHVSLLICMLSPCFFLQPRYAFPIMFTIPFLMGFLSPGLEIDTKA